MKEQAKLEKRFKPWVKWYKKLGHLCSDEKKQENIDEIVRKAFAGTVKICKPFLFSAITLESRMKKMNDHGRTGQIPLYDNFMANIPFSNDRLRKWLFSSPVHDKKYEKDISWHAVDAGVVFEHCLCKFLSSI